MATSDRSRTSLCGSLYQCERCGVSLESLSAKTGRRVEIIGHVADHRVSDGRLKDVDREERVRRPGDELGVVSEPRDSQQGKDDNPDRDRKRLDPSEPVLIPNQQQPAGGIK